MRVNKQLAYKERSGHKQTTYSGMENRVHISLLCESFWITHSQECASGGVIWSIAAAKPKTVRGLLGCQFVIFLQRDFFFASKTKVCVSISLSLLQRQKAKPLGSILTTTQVKANAQRKHSLGCKQWWWWEGHHVLQARHIRNQSFQQMDKL